MNQPEMRQEIYSDKYLRKQEPKYEFLQLLIQTQTTDLLKSQETSNK